MSKKISAALATALIAISVIAAAAPAQARVKDTSWDIPRVATHQH